MPGGIGFGIQIAGNAFAVLDKAAKKAHAGIMGVVKKSATRVQRDAKVNVKQRLNTTGKSTGALGRSISVKNRPADLASDIGPAVIYGRIHELGGVIKPVKAQRLVFEIGGQVRTAMQVTIPKRPYLQPALDTAKPKIEREFRALVGDLLEE